MGRGQRLDMKTASGERIDYGNPVSLSSIDSWEDTEIRTVEYPCDATKYAFEYADEYCGDAGEYSWFDGTSVESSAGFLKES